MRLSTLSEMAADVVVFFALLAITTLGSCEKKVQCGAEAAPKAGTHSGTSR